MADALSGKQVGETSRSAVAGGPGNESYPKLSCLIREAVRLLEAADLPGANETLKEAEKALGSREGAVR
ncbi:MAG: hypothetical protein ACFB50_11050 [Rubrobacteraceae bacterium]